ncbi:MAG TPA: AAA family ATPase [Azospirillaceae bacterium]|mgnify:CR=1 FL=1|nr:AAA family ATPase [Azospirillaceae bacterium]HRQ80048.1 AAA family ATPase [Azospirillaceae bacterium]
MNGEKLSFDDALPLFAHHIVHSLGADALENGRFIRDVFGRLAYVGRGEKDYFRSAQSDLPIALHPFLMNGGKTGDVICVTSDDDMAARLLNDPYLSVRVTRQGTEYRINLIDRRLAGEDWLVLSDIEPPVAPKRFAFYSIKGGVGRSTALCVAAAELARRGQRVLAVDFDLEAPGLGSLLRKEDKVPDYGVVDWFVAAGLGMHDDMLLDDLIGESVFTTGDGFVDVVSAGGKKTLENAGDYLGKLARVYTPGAAKGEFVGRSFTAKAAAFLQRLEANKSYDTVLIDVRAGLHETSAASVLGLGAEVLMFAADSAQNFDDYRYLFGHLSRLVETDPSKAAFRERLKMVQGKAPPLERDRKPFTDACWGLWLNGLYDVADADAPDAFSFDLDNEEAPHYPLYVIGTDVYSRFDPRKNPELLDTNFYNAFFGAFVDYFSDGQT